jgi:hypothetical protein
LAHGYAELSDTNLMGTESKPNSPTTSRTVGTACIPFTEFDYGFYILEPWSALQGIVDLLREIQTTPVEQVAPFIGIQQRLALTLHQSDYAILEFSEGLRDRFEVAGHREPMISFTRADLNNYRSTMMPLITAFEVNGPLDIAMAGSDGSEDEWRNVAASLKALRMIQIFLESAISKLNALLCAVEEAVGVIDLKVSVAT